MFSGGTLRFPKLRPSLSDDQSRRLHGNDDDNDETFKAKHATTSSHEEPVCNHGCDKSTGVAMEIARKTKSIPKDIIEFLRREKHNPESITPAKARAFMMMRDEDIPMRSSEKDTNSMAVVNFFGDDSNLKDSMKLLHLMLPHLSKLQGQWTEPLRYKGGYPANVEFAKEGEAPMDRDLIQVTGIGVPLELWVSTASQVFVAQVVLLGG